MNQIRSVCEEGNYTFLFKTHSRSVRNFIYYRCGDLERAEDITQECMVRLWENCAEVIFEKTKSYLFTMAHRLMIDMVRHDKVKLDFTKQSETLTENDPSYLLIKKEFQKKLEEAIASLPETQREAFLMNRMDKMSYAEIAELLGISVKAVEKRMHLALLTLKDKVKELQLFKI
ncbi:MAG: sigma-70 family RNA polymerase sigma factor [Bacteroidia bacterium]|nr:sigma-70 family RNA polymerase sigma factor [Bacteroidia bacterium]